MQGYEERLCRRSSLAAALAIPGPEPWCQANFPVPSTGGIYSPCVGESGWFINSLLSVNTFVGFALFQAYPYLQVRHMTANTQPVVFRGAQYENLAFEAWDRLPVVSVPPTRWPKLVPNGSKYSFSDERAMVKDKIRGALRICAYNNQETVVIAGDWGLGNGHRNPPRELAEVWREVLLYDPELRGRIREACFVFEDASQCTAQLILTEMSKKDSKKSGKGKEGSKSKSPSSVIANCGPTDAEIYNAVFDEGEVRRVLGQPDARYGLDNLLTK